ncbi:unnamed protein product [Caenorhabditis bovis]|uniref:Uncharacterized protein n=1 Tax=Caenorhabditis bovis TaxID=2654633 RepID=A0A8S1EUV2_9PELO|nr:unnamed protein product [Caenorhabditis bovis]
MSSRNFDLEYDDYLKRRGSQLPPKKFTPADEENEAKAKKQVKQDYGLPNNEYFMQGYQEKSADVGSDPIGAVRTLRNNLRVMSLEHKDKDEPVKSFLCQSACDELTKTEKKLLEMSNRRSDAIFRGDTDSAQKIANDMERVKSDAIRNAYSDLMIDDKQVERKMGRVPTMT